MLASTRSRVMKVLLSGCCRVTGTPGRVRCRADDRPVVNLNVQVRAYDLSVEYSSSVKIGLWRTNQRSRTARGSRPSSWASGSRLMGLLMILPASLDAQLKRDAGLNLFEYHILVELAEAPERAARDERTRHPDPRFAVALVPCGFPPGGGRVGGAALLRRGGRAHRSRPDRSGLAEAPADRARTRTRGSPAGDRRPDAPNSSRTWAGGPPHRRRGQPRDRRPLAECEAPCAEAS